MERNSIRFSISRKLGVLLLIAVVVPQINGDNPRRMVCFYDDVNFRNQVNIDLVTEKLEPAVEYCDYLIFGYAEIVESNLKTVKPARGERGVSHYRQIIKLKEKHPQLKVLLSVGGGVYSAGDETATTKEYLSAMDLEANANLTAESISHFLGSYGFDGVDLAWRFPSKPTNKESQQQLNGVESAWNSFKTWISGAQSDEINAAEHRRVFSILVREVRNTLPKESIISLTILPHIDVHSHIDIASVHRNVDFINLATFDFHTPQREPHVADHPAALYPRYQRADSTNVDYQVKLWLNASVPAEKINMGIPAFGRTWTLTKESGVVGYPPIANAHGSAPAGPRTQIPGLLSWPEICTMLPYTNVSNLHNNNNYYYYNNNNNNNSNRVPQQQLQKIGDPMKRSGIYAFRVFDKERDEPGIWIGYDDPKSASNKAIYVRNHQLGGVAFFDLSMDDYDGVCSGAKFPILRSIKFKL